MNQNEKKEELQNKKTKKEQETKIKRTWNRKQSKKKNRFEHGLRRNAKDHSPPNKK